MSVVKAKDEEADFAKTRTWGAIPMMLAFVGSNPADSTKSKMHTIEEQTFEKHQTIYLIRQIGGEYICWDGAVYSPGKLTAKFITKADACFFANLHGLPVIKESWRGQPNKVLQGSG